MRALYASVEPGALSRLGGVASYAPPLGLSEAMTGAAVGEVLKSRHEGFAPGDVVAGGWGWREHAVVGARTVRKAEAGAWPASAVLGVFGIPGLPSSSPNRLRMEGFVVYDYAGRFAQTRAELRRWVAEGALRYRVSTWRRDWRPRHASSSGRTSDARWCGWDGNRPDAAPPRSSTRQAFLGSWCLLPECARWSPVSQTRGGQ